MLRKRIEAGFAAAKAWYEKNKYGLEMWDVKGVLRTYPDWLEYCKQHKGGRTGAFSEMTADDYAFYKDLISNFAALHGTTYEELLAGARGGLQESEEDIVVGPDTVYASARDYLLADPGHKPFEDWLENAGFTKMSPSTWKFRGWFGKLIVQRHGEDRYRYTTYDMDGHKLAGKKVMRVSELAATIQADLKAIYSDENWEGPGVDYNCGGPPGAVYTP